MSKILWFGLGVAATLLVFVISKIPFPEWQSQLFRNDPFRSANQINVPADRYGWFRPEPVNIVYPGGNRIRAHKQVAGDRLLSIVLDYRLSGGNMRISCADSPDERYISFYVMTGQTNFSSSQTTLRFSSGKNEVLVLAQLVPSSEEMSKTTMRSMIIKDTEMETALTFITSVHFPAGVLIAVIDQTGQWHPLDNIPTTGVVEPAAWRASFNDQIPQPPSDPFQVMASYCRQTDK